MLLSLRINSNFAFFFFQNHSTATTDDKNLNGKIRKQSHEVVEENILALNNDSKKLSKDKKKHKSKDKHREHKSKKSKSEDKTRPTELDLLGISPPKKTDAEKDAAGKHHKKSKKEKHHRKDKIKASEYEEALGISTPSKEVL